MGSGMEENNQGEKSGGLDCLLSLAPPLLGTSIMGKLHDTR